MQHGAAAEGIQGVPCSRESPLFPEEQVGSGCHPGNGSGRFPATHPALTGDPGHLPAGAAGTRRQEEEAGDGPGGCAQADREYSGVEVAKRGTGRSRAARSLFASPSSRCSGAGSNRLHLPSDKPSLGLCRRERNGSCEDLPHLVVHLSYRRSNIAGKDRMRREFPCKTGVARSKVIYWLLWIHVSFLVSLTLPSKLG